MVSPVTAIVAATKCQSFNTYSDIFIRELVHGNHIMEPIRYVYHIIFYLIFLH